MTPYGFRDWKNGKPPPKGWDCADAIEDGWTKDEILSFMKSTVKMWQPAPSVVQDAAPAPGAEPPQPPANRAEPVRQLKQTDQAEPSTVTSIKTRRTVSADDGWQTQLVTNDEGKVKPGVSKNWALFIENHPEMIGVIAYDEFKMLPLMVRCPPWYECEGEWEPTKFDEADYSELVMWLEAHYMTPKLSNIIPVVVAVAKRNSYDPLTDYLEGVEWDGVPRIDDFFSKYAGADEFQYVSTISRKWLVSAVARALRPGCKVDTMPILEGPQGAKKSSMLPALFGRTFFTDEISDIRSKDAMIEMGGVWCVEIAEMHRFSAAETNNVKKFITRQVDRFRPPFGRTLVEAPRRAIMVGTINPEGNPYLRDPTGARRFWPIKVGKIDVPAIEADRDQIWAEAVAAFKAGEIWWLDQSEELLAQAEQGVRTDVDVWTDLISPMTLGKTKLSQHEILLELGVPSKDVNWLHTSRIAKIMKRLGWEQRRNEKVGASQTYYVDPLRHDENVEFGDVEW